MVSGIYKITCSANGKFYIGSSVDVNKRFRTHKARLNEGKHHARYMQNCWKKYGKDNFTFEIIEVSETDKLIELEQKYIDELRPHFNTAKTAGSRLGVRHTEETKQKLRIAHQRPECLAKQRLAAKNRTPEHRAAIAKSCRENPRRLGTKTSDEARKRMSSSHKGYKVKDETKEKIKVNTTKRWKDEDYKKRTGKAISKAKKGIKMSGDILEKQIQKNKKLASNPEWLRKNREAHQTASFRQKTSARFKRLPTLPAPDGGDSPAQLSLFSPEVLSAIGHEPTPAPRR